MKDYSPKRGHLYIFV